MAEVYVRASNLLDSLEKKYLSYLEELRAREDELLGKDVLSPSEVVELIGIRASIKVIAEELGLEYEPGISEVFDIMEIDVVREEAEVSA